MISLSYLDANLLSLPLLHNINQKKSRGIGMGSEEQHFVKCSWTQKSIIGIYTEPKFI